MKYEQLHAFVAKHGDVTAWARKAVIGTLKAGEKDLIGICEKAEHFEHKGKTYSKAEFEKLVSAAN